MDAGLSDILSSYENYQEWRDTRYWTKQCETVIKENYEFFQKLYNTWAGKRKAEAKKFSTKKFMTSSEFKDLWGFYDLYDEYLYDRDITVIFNASMMSQVSTTRAPQ